MMMKNFIIASFVFFGIGYSMAQDTLQVLSISDFINIVREFHPLGKQAGLRIEYGKQNLKANRGAFDPYLYGDLSQKYFDKKQYYDLLNAGMKIPTWFGIELDAGFEQADGTFVNPQRSTPTNGLVYAGISVPIGQDLFIDQRRADLRKAQVYQQITENEQKILINDLFKAAISAYWEWVGTAQKYAIYQEGLELARVRFSAVTSSVQAGESPAIDTVEAYIQYQNRRISLQDAELNFRNAKAQIEVFIWNKEGIPLELGLNIRPPKADELNSSIDLDIMQEHIDSLLTNHPKLAKNQLYLEQMNIQRQLDLERLKPQLDLKYNALNQPLNGDIMEGYSMNNYNWGLTFKMPIFLRKERGQLQKTNINIMEQNYTLDNLERTLFYNVTAAFNTWETTQQQLNGYTEIVSSTDRLFRAELQKFQSGESSLFLVNAREIKYINTQVKFIDLFIKSQKAYMDIEYQLGRLN
jgi:outer membrane protein TolC